jgi:DNA primase
MQKKATPLSRYLLEHLSEGLDLNSPEGRSQLLHKAKPLVLQIPAPALRLQILKRLAELAQVNQSEVEGLYDVRAYSPRSSGPAREIRTAMPGTAQLLLQWIALRPGLAAKLDLGLFDAQSDEGAVFFAITEWVQEMSDRELTPAMLAEHFRGSAVELVLAAAKVDGIRDGFSEDEAAQEFEGLQSQMRVKRYEAELDGLKKKSGQGELSAAEEARFRQLTQERNDLREQQKGSPTI